METLFSVVLLAGGVGVVGFLTWERHDFAKSLVLGELGRLHATRIELSLDWTDFDRDTMTYDVEYSTPDGMRHANRCKISSHPAADQAVFWERALKGAASRRLETEGRRR